MTVVATVEKREEFASHEIEFGDSLRAVFRIQCLDAVILFLGLDEYFGIK